jgi:hypothetical protein
MIGSGSALLRHYDLFQQNVVYFANLCHLVREIYMFNIYNYIFKCPLRKNSVSWDLELGFNLAFK